MPFPPSAFAVIKTSNSQDKKPPFRIIYACSAKLDAPHHDSAPEKDFNRISLFNEPLELLLTFGLESDKSHPEVNVVAWTHTRADAEALAEKDREEVITKAEEEESKVVNRYHYDLDGSVEGLSLKIEGDKYHWWDIVQVNVQS